MSQNLQKFAKFQKFQLDNLIDFEKCCKTRIFLQKSVPIQPKTSNILPKFCQPTLSDVAAMARPRAPWRDWARFNAAAGTERRGEKARTAGPESDAGSESDAGLAPLSDAVEEVHFSKMRFRKMHFSKILQIFGGLVLGCIKTKFCKKICV